jgi:hypothetical protein
MKLVDIAKKPSLQRMELNDEATIKQYGEALEFWCYDRQPLDSFLKFANKANDPGVMVEILSSMILNEDGTPVMKDGLTLPPEMMVRVANKLMEFLGNSLEAV